MKLKRGDIIALAGLQIQDRYPKLFLGVFAVVEEIEEVDNEIFICENLCICVRGSLIPEVSVELDDDPLAA